MDKTDEPSHILKYDAVAVSFIKVLSYLVAVILFRFLDVGVNLTATSATPLVARFLSFK